MTRTTVVEDAVFLAVFAVIGYSYAQRMRRRVGTTPWRLPPFVWAVISGLLPIYGFLLEMLAGVTTKGTRGRFSAPNGFDGSPGSQPDRPGGGYSPWPATPANPAGGQEAWPDEQSSRPGPNGWTASPGGEPAPLFGWYPDPEGAHQERYWDGRYWTDTVRDDGVVSSAPLGPALPPWVSAGVSGEPGEPGEGR